MFRAIEMTSFASLHPAVYIFWHVWSIECNLLFAIYLNIHERIMNGKHFYNLLYIHSMLRSISIVWLRFTHTHKPTHSNYNEYKKWKEKQVKKNSWLICFHKQISISWTSSNQYSISIIRWKYPFDLVPIVQLLDWCCLFYVFEIVCYFAENSAINDYVKLVKRKK